MLTKTERIAELEELRALAVSALKIAYKAQAYSVAGRSKQMAQITDLREQIREYDRELKTVEMTGIQLQYGVPE